MKCFLYPFYELWSVLDILSVNYEVFITSFLWIVPDIKLTACHLLYLSMNYEVFLTSSWQHVIVLSLSMNIKCSWHPFHELWSVLDIKLTSCHWAISFLTQGWHTIVLIFHELWSVLDIKLMCHCVISFYNYEVFLASSWQHVIVLYLCMNCKVFLT